MNKIYKLLLIILMFTIGCKSTDKKYKNISQVINNFDMNIYSKEGNKMLAIKSPFSQYESIYNNFNLKETTIHLFKNNNIEYIINSDESKLSNNKLLELNGNVLVKNNFELGDKLNANSFTWNIQNSDYLLIGNVKFENNTIILSSNKAVLNNNSKIIKFFNPVNYINKDSNKEKRYEIKSENAYYNIKTKSVIFRSNDERVRSKIYF